MGSHHWPSWWEPPHPLGALGAGAAPGPPLPCKVSLTLMCWEENLQFLPRRCAVLVQPERAVLKVTDAYHGVPGLGTMPTS